MRARIRSKLTYANVAATLAIVMGLGGFAIASIPNANGVFTGCITSAQNQNVLRVIDESTSNCAEDEQRITWNQQGVQGPTGATGPPGAKGAKGDTGPPGPRVDLEARTAVDVMSMLFGTGRRNQAVRLNVFPGVRYLLVASGQVSGTSADSSETHGAIVDCDIEVGGQILSPPMRDWLTVPRRQRGNGVNLSGSALYTVPASTNKKLVPARVTCQIFGVDGRIERAVSEFRLTAIALG